MREVRRLLDQRLFQRQQLGQLPGRRLPHRRRGTVVAVLLEQRDAQPRRARDAAARGLDLTREQPEQGGLPRTVAAHDTPSLARLDVERYVGKEGGVAEIQADAAETDLAHEAGLTG